MYSPLTLFADACSADASDAYEFNKAVIKYIENKNLENQKIVTDFFKKWITMNTDLIHLSANAPLIQPV
jgi:hexosaminidase